MTACNGNKKSGKPENKGNKSGEEGSEMLHNGLKILARIIARDIFEKNKLYPSDGKNK